VGVENHWLAVDRPRIAGNRRIGPRISPQFLPSAKPAESPVAATTGQNLRQPADKSAKSAY
jgi:hypothetical protein